MIELTNAQCITMHRNHFSVKFGDIETESKNWDQFRFHLIYTNTKSLAKEFSEILIFEYFIFRFLKTGFDVFLTLIPITPHDEARRVKMQPWGVMGEKLIFMWSRDQCLAKQDKRLRFSVRFGIGLGYDSGDWFGSGSGSEIRAYGLQKWCHVTAHWRVI